jgi:hypothetical protein
MRATRQVIVVVAVTTALCAEPCVAAAAPSAAQRAGVEDLNHLAGQLVSRFTRNLRKAASRILPCELGRQAHHALAGRVAPVRFEAEAAPVVRQPTSPFQFRLPPPTF